jgi:hypothetical protein
MLLKAIQYLKLYGDGKLLQKESKRWKEIREAWKEQNRKEKEEKDKDHHHNQWTY